MGFRECGRIPIARFMQVCGCFTMPCFVSVGCYHCFPVSEWKLGCEMVGSSIRSPPVGMFSCHSCFHFLEVEIVYSCRIEGPSRF